MNNNVSAVNKFVSDNDESKLLDYLRKCPSSRNKMFGNIINLIFQARQCIPYYDNPNQSIQEYVYKLLKSDDGLNVGIWTSIPKWRTDFKIPESIIISKICEKYLSKDDKTVEIGAGRLESGLSYLMQRMPPHLNAIVEPTEVNPFFTKDTEDLKRVDLCDMSRSYSLSSVDKIIGSSVLDVLSKSQLPIAMQQIHNTLKIGGLLISFTHEAPFHDTLLTSFREDTSICFPWADQESFKGLLRIDKVKLLRDISRNKKISDFTRNFLSLYCKLTASEREFTLNSLLSNLNKEIIIEFSDWIQEVIPQKLEKIDNEVYFEERMRQALETAKFKILEFGYRWKSHVRDRRADDDINYNYFICDLGIKKSLKIYVLDTSKVLNVVKMHLIIAQKL